MNEFIVGKKYRFQVVGIREENETKYIYLSDGYKETFRVKPFDYQLEWESFNLPDTIYCYVKNITIWGLPELVQSRKEVFEHCYTEPDSEYAFKLIAIQEDVNTKKTYYDVKDAFGLRHRYYPSSKEPKHDIGDIFSLVFRSIEEKDGNNTFLKLAYPENLKVTISDITPDPRTESKFGYENDFKEFKSTIVYPAGNREADIDKQILIIVKTIAGFQNSNGGELYLGVNDSGVVCGINNDYLYLNSSKVDAYSYQKNTDGFENKIRTAIRYYLGSTSNGNVIFTFYEENRLEYCIIKITAVLKPVFMSGSKLYQRAGNMTQILKGDEITWFVEERYLKRNQSVLQPKTLSETQNIEEVIEDDTTALENNKETKEVVPVIAETPIISIKSIDTKIWYYLTFYKNGDWTFQNKAITTDDVEYELPILDALKKERMLMVYKNGCVNVVIPYDIINPKGINGRKLKTKGKIYKNGWNINSKIVTMFCINHTDMVVFNSEKSDGTAWIKIHTVTAISVHTSLGLEGNVLINSKLDATLTSVYPLSRDNCHLISGLILKDSQTSGYLGFKTTERNYQKSIKLLEQLKE